MALRANPTLFPFHRRSSLVLHAGIGLVLLILHAPDRTSDREAPSWDVTATLHGYEGADTQPGVDEKVAFCEEQSLQLMAAAGHISFENVTADRPTEEDQRRLFWILKTGIALYPDGFLQHAGLRTVAFTRNAHTRTGSLGGLSYSGGRVVLDAATRDPNHVLHHEFFHTIARAGLDLGRWSALNPDDFSYRGDAWGSSPPKSPCFVSAYATSNVSDDQAEVFATVMTYRPISDECVLRKAELLTRALSARFPELPARIAAYLPADLREPAGGPHHR